MRSEEGDFIGGGREYDYTPGNATFTVGGTRTHVSFFVRGTDGRYVSGDFEAPAGDILAPGTYEGALRYRFNGPAPGLDVNADSRGCNEVEGTFTVTEATFGRDGVLRSFGATFEQHCEGNDPALYGVVEFRADPSSEAPVPPGGEVPPDPEPEPEEPPAQPPPGGGPTQAPVAPPVSGQPPTTPGTVFPPAPPSPALPAITPPGTTAAVAPSPAKMRVERARVRGGRLDILARITDRAEGSVLVAYRAAGRTTRFTAPIEGRTIRIDRKLRGAQARTSTGIVTLTYQGSDSVRPDEVRLRAASQRAELQRSYARVHKERLEVGGTVSERARGVVRVRLGFETPGGGVGFENFRARIRDGRWKVDEPLSGHAARGGHLSIQYTGYLPARVRGEQTTKQVQAGG
jgi:hypothetical protein